MGASYGLDGVVWREGDIPHGCVVGQQDIIRLREADAKPRSTLTGSSLRALGRNDTSAAPMSHMFRCGIP